MDNRLSSAMGCLIGGAVGDALGYPVEFLSWKDIRKRCGDSGIHRLEKDFEQGLALVSDDTQMTLFTANGLLMCETRDALSGEGPSPVECVYDAYRDWYHCQCHPSIPANNRSWLSELPEMHERRAPGNTCLSALGRGEPGSIEAPVNHSKGCGGIMRVAPIALWRGGKLTLAEADMLAARAAALTHGHPLGYMPAAALVDVIGRVLAGTRDVYAAVEACRGEMRALFRDEGDLAALLDVIDLAVALSRNDLPDVENIRRIGEGWTGEEALGVALYCSLKYQDDFSRAVIAAVNHDGDSDSTGAITGNIVGARLGYEAIDARWLKGLELRETILELARDLCDGCPAGVDGASEDTRWTQRYAAWCDAGTR